MWMDSIFLRIPNSKSRIQNSPFREFGTRAILMRIVCRIVWKCPGEWGRFRFVKPRALFKWD